MAQRIDGHHHLWRYNEADFSWITEDMRAIRRDFLLEDLRAAMATAQVDGTVAVQARQTTDETRWLLSLAAAEGSPLWGVVGWLPLAEGSFSALLETFLAFPQLKGLRHVVQDEPAGFLDHAPFNRGIRALQGTGLVYDLLIYAHQLKEATRFVDRHPHQAFVLDHAGKPDIRTGEINTWSSDLRELALRPNVSCKASGMITEADWQHGSIAQLQSYFDVVLEAFGPQRLMVGTDWPVLTVGCTYADWWGAVATWTAELSGNEQADILGETAIRVYHLEKSLGGAPVVTQEKLSA